VASLPALIEAAAAAPIAGDALVHLDVRSDNVCFSRRGVVVIDWPEAAIANPALDVAFWLPSLEADGGPRPDDVLPNTAELAAWVAGFFFSRAAAPPIVDAPYVRPLQLAQSRSALPWAARQLALSPPRPVGQR
jgi:aminoglycoside phosphotransferase (APT) family kinase protein